MDELAKISLNLDPELLAAIDRRAKDVGLNRTEWISRCTRWAIHNLPYKDTPEARDPKVKARLAREAPDDVAGSVSEDMGLSPAAIQAERDATKSRITAAKPRR